MITSALLYIIYAVLYLILSGTILLLPDVGQNSSVVSAITTLTPYAAVINLVAPLDTVFQIFAASAAIFLIVALYRLILWIIKLIRG